MTMAWKQVKEHLGVAIHNFVHGTPYAMRLTVGEMVQILEECGDWYYGRNKSKGTCGIFPKSYIHILQQSMSMDCLIHEITNVLREWGHHWKHLYMIHSVHFRTMQQQILELIGYRSKILSGTLTVDELKDVKRLATARIDTGNQLLGMDMVVRDDQGNVLNPEETSTIQLYYHHERAAERIRKATNDTKQKPPKPQAPVYSHIFFVSVRNFVCKMAEDVELLLTLYDGKEMKAITNMRRPFGVAAMDITLYITGKLEGDSDHHHFIPFVHCCEKESLDGTLRRILSQKETNIQKNSNGNSGSFTGGQGLWASLKLLRGDPKQVRDENPHLVLGNVAIARKMGFPEVILPGDVRNDLYLTLISGEFNKGSKSTDKNVEVTVRVCNEFGVPIPGVMTLGGGASPIDEYHSVIYYHEDKPRWCETFKIAVPIEEFKQAHLKFTFKHRSSNEAKDKKPFALSYVKLMQRNGTTLQDIQHELLVYKLDQKKYEETDISYLKLPSTRDELVELNIEKKPTLGALTLSSKDSFLIATNVCSTKLTQNVDLLGLLNWASHNTDLRESLIALMKVDGEEVVKFLQDVLDALFNILMSNSDSDVYDDMFSATLAYKKLIAVLRKRIDNATNNDTQERDILLKTMKSLQYCMRFVVESRLLFTALNEDEEEFSQTLTELLRSIVELMRHETDSTLLVQGACLKYLPTTIPHLLRVYSGKQLSTILTDLLVTLPVGRLTKQKMMTVNDIVHSPLFLSAECRAILLPRITILVRDLLEAKEEGLSSTPGNSVAKVARLLGEKRHRLNQHRGYSEEVELCVKILSDILELTFKKDVGSTVQDVKEIMLTALRTIIQTVISMDRENPLVGNLVSVMLAIFRQMTQHHYEIYINHFGTKFDLLDFLMEILLVFKDLVSKSVFPGDWCEMIMLQNSIILKSLRYFSGTIRDCFFTDFEQQAWSNFFHCAIAFLTQPTLQLETFTPSKRNRIVSRYNDMRRETAFEIRSMWFNLGQHKILFVPALVGAILEMALIPESELRKATIPIFFDMMQCEFYSSRIVEGYGDTKRDPAHIKANFIEYENEMIAKLDILVEGGRGDEQFRLLWIQVMGNLCEKHSTMREQGLRFVDIVAKLMERLLQYRDIIHAESQEHRMLCIVNLLEFYSEINRNEMYIRYVNKLCELHLECDNYTEAAYSLKLHSQLLAWSDQPLSPLLRSHRYLICQTHRELKEALYNDMIEYFDKGKMWECALAVCKELVAQYEEETFDYLQLSVLLTRMAKFYDSIVKQLRPEPEYFRVAYYGRGHPAFLQNKVFIYRGKEYERLSDFCSRTLNQLPNAEQMNKLSPPTSEMLESSHQYVQINRVDPLMDEKRHRLSGKPITAEAVLRYHRVNDVQRFRFSRPAPKKDLTSTTVNSGDKEKETITNNEFASLWLERTVLVTSHPLPGILRCFPVTSSETYLVSPLRNAIETMEATNTTLRDLILAHKADNNIPLNPLSMKLNGILDPAVMGGIDNYEKAFLNSEYRNTHPEESSDLLKLEGLIAEQIPLLSVGVQLHKVRAPPELIPFHQRLEQCFISMRNQVEAKYGKRTCDLQIENLTQPVTMRRHQTSRGENHRLSESNIMNSDGGTHSRVSSLTRTQVATFKSLASFNFNNSTSSSGIQNVSLSRNSSIRSHILSTASLQKALGSPSPGTNKKKDSKRRSSRKSDSIASTKSDQPTSQWYTTADVSQVTSTPVTPLTSSFPTTPLFELRQELTPKRPLRSEVEKERRISNRLSGQSQHYLRNINNGTDSSSLGKGNRDSIGTTDSTASEDDPPPPLPMKTREADYYNLPEELPVQHCGTGSLNNFNRSLGQWSKNKLPTPTDDLDIQTRPPTPPPKPKRPPYSLNKLILSSDIDNFSQDPSVT
ncbi:Dedicator of cytokinesis protein 2 [Melipona quadrifasciata]|uniref:Dedicator of cytokinesis protein 2 n=1 Tax=Melipona quadrifasciata TaxID=166423 RepID=A0A0N0BK65_9HYME|nr:Dedicator of cytokinesis protein 2 [Melipona quadrifasciata]